MPTMIAASNIVDLFFTLDDLYRFYLAAHPAGQADFPDHKPMTKRQFRNAIGPAAKHLFNLNRKTKGNFQMTDFFEADTKQPKTA
jgi:hypothetical protein